MNSHEFHDATTGDRLPNPGSTAARALGCICPVLDNHRGLYPPFPGAWWISGDWAPHSILHGEVTS